MQYEIVRASLGINTFQWYVYDSAGFLDAQGYVTTGYNAAVNAAKAHIDAASGAPGGGDIGDSEYDDSKPIQGVPVRPVNPVKPVGITYPHMMYDCKTGKGYMAYRRDDHERYRKLGYVHNLSECEVLPPTEDDSSESSGDNGILETAGVFVVGVAKGTLIAAVPITAMAVAVGFMRRIVRFGVGVGS
jgi:hypothetical protein